MKGIMLLRCACTRLGIVTMLLSPPVAPSASAQTTGAVEGAVVDANGNPLPGVVVTLSGPDVRLEQVTGADGW